LYNFFSCGGVSTMKKIALIILLTFMACHLNGKELGVLNETLNPDQIRVSGDRCFILQGPDIFVYDLKDLKLLKHFGKKGEGPGEVQSIPFIPNGLAVVGNNLFVDAISKVVFFSFEGEFKKEVRKKGRVVNALPVGDGFIVTRLKPDEKVKKIYAVITLMDAEMNEIKELHSQLLAQQGTDVQMIPDAANMSVYEDKIFIEKSSEGFIIEVFDSKGNSLYKITKDFPPLKLTEKDKETVLKELIEDRVVQFQIKQRGTTWDEFKKRLNLHYPDAYPQIHDMLVDNGKIYIRTYATRNGKEKYLIFDLKGKEINSVFLPKPILAPLVTRMVGRPVRYFDIANDQFYYLMENDDEDWVLNSELIR
jgi:hypothetical protein